MLFLGFPVQTIGGIHTLAIFEEFEKKLQANPKSIVFTEGTDDPAYYDRVCSQSYRD